MASNERPVVMFMFAGRRGNMELNLPMIERILRQYPQVQFHVWNLTRNNHDSSYLKTIKMSDVFVYHTHAGPRAFQRLPRVWRHYTNPRFRDCLFVKVDDDVVFLETERFGDFLDAVENNPETVVSADVVNNGACTPLTPGLWEGFSALDIPLLDVHMSNEYAHMAHGYMFDHWQEMIGQPVRLVDTEDWLSINFIGLHHSLLCRISDWVGRRSPKLIAGREWTPRHRVGDEGAANMYPRAIVQGFTVAHLGFGPQDLTPEQETALRAEYAVIGDKYLAGVRQPDRALP